MIDINFIRKNYLNIHSPGYVIGVSKYDNIYEYIIGNRSNYPDDLKLDENTLYDIASLTKTFTATLVFMAYEENKINLNDFIINIDDNFKNLSKITFLDLLCHHQEIWTDGYLGLVNSKKEFYDILYSSYIKSDERKYIDVHYIILSTLLEKIYNKSYNELIIEKIKKPLNLTSLTFKPDTQNIAITNYENKKDGTVVDCIGIGEIHDTKARTARNIGIHTEHASIFITGSDLLKFLKSFLDCSLLKKQTIRKMLCHDDVNMINYNHLKSIVPGNDINKMYEFAKKSNISINLCKPYNYMGARYKNAILAENDIPLNASCNSITFSGYTGPMYLIDFDKKIIIVIMCNVTNNNSLMRSERKDKTSEIIYNIYNQIVN